MSYLRVKFNFKRERGREFLDIEVVDIRDLDWDENPWDIIVTSNLCKLLRLISRVYRR